MKKYLVVFIISLLCISEIFAQPVAEESSFSYFDGTPGIDNKNIYCNEEISELSLQVLEDFMLSSSALVFARNKFVSNPESVVITVTGGALDEYTGPGLNGAYDFEIKDDSITWSCTMDHSSIKIFPSDRLDEADYILGSFCEDAVVTGSIITNSKEMIFEAEIEFPNPEVGSHSFFCIGHLEDESFPFVFDGRKYILSTENILKSISAEELENSVILNL